MFGGVIAICVIAVVIILSVITGILISKYKEKRDMINAQILTEVSKQLNIKIEDIELMHMVDFDYRRDDGSLVEQYCVKHDGHTYLVDVVYKKNKSIDYVFAYQVN